MREGATVAEFSDIVFEGQPVRVRGDGAGVPGWVGRDVCAALGLVHVARSLASLADDERGVSNVNTPGGVQSVTVVNEPGLYRLIFRSRKPAAERFRRWLAHEVLPALRRGAVIVPAPDADISEVSERWISLIREARRTHGRAAAVRLWAQSPLPQVAAPDDLAARFFRDFIAQCCEVTGRGSDAVRARDLRSVAHHWALETGRPWPGDRAFSSGMIRYIERDGPPGVAYLKRSAMVYCGLVLRMGAGGGTLPACTRRE